MITKLIDLKGHDAFPCKYKETNQEWNLEDLERSSDNVYFVKGDRDPTEQRYYSFNFCEHYDPKKFAETTWCHHDKRWGFVFKFNKGGITNECYPITGADTDGDVTYDFFIDDTDHSTGLTLNFPNSEIECPSGIAGSTFSMRL